MRRISLKHFFAAAAAMISLSGCEGLTSSMTGEENLHGDILFTDLETKGDPRLKRIVAMLRKSTTGEALYQSGRRHNFFISWDSNNGDDIGGSYEPRTNELQIDAHLNDKKLVAILAHELRHHWQATTLGAMNWVVDPVQYWQLSRLIEADACAFTAHFVAEYKQQTGVSLAFKKGYGSQTMRSYMRTGTEGRNYLKDAVEPCFAELTRFRTYEQSHFANVASMSANFEKAIFDPFHPHHVLVLEYFRKTPGADSVKASFSGFLTPTLDPTATIPEIRQMDSAAFGSWVKAMTPSLHADRINRMNARFYDLRDSALASPQKSRNPAPDS